MRGFSYRASEAGETEADLGMTSVSALSHTVKTVFTQHSIMIGYALSTVLQYYLLSDAIYDIYE